MWVFILCLAKDGTFHNLRCLKGECEDCVINMFMTYHGEENKNNEKLMSWKCYHKVVHGKIGARLDNMVLRLQYKETTPKEFLSYTFPWL